MSIDILGVLALVALAFIIGVRVGVSFLRWHYRHNSIIAGVVRDAQVADAADMASDADERADDLRLY